MADLGGGFVPPPVGPEVELLARAKLDEAALRRRTGPGGGRRRRRRGQRFGLLRRLLQFIRGGGD